MALGYRQSVKAADKSGTPMTSVAGFYCMEDSVISGKVNRKTPAMGVDVVKG